MDSVWKRHFNKKLQKPRKTLKSSKTIKKHQKCQIQQNIRNPTDSKYKKQKDDLGLKRLNCQSGSVRLNQLLFLNLQLKNQMKQQHKTPNYGKT